MPGAQPLPPPAKTLEKQKDPPKKKKEKKHIYIYIYEAPFTHRADHKSVKKEAAPHALQPWPLDQPVPAGQMPCQMKLARWIKKDVSMIHVFFYSCHVYSQNVPSPVREELSSPQKK